MESEPVFFSNNVEALFVRRLMPTLSPQQLAQLKGLGLDLQTPLLPAYPYRVWERALATVVDARPGPRAESYRWLGAENVLGAMGTPLGQATLQVAKLIGLERVFKRLPHTQRNYNNLYTLECEPVSAGVLKLRFFVNLQFAGKVPPREDPEVIHFNSGSYLQLIELLGGRGGRVELLSHDVARRHTEYQVSWTR